MLCSLFIYLTVLLFSPFLFHFTLSFDSNVTLFSRDIFYSYADVDPAGAARGN